VACGTFFGRRLDKTRDEESKSEKILNWMRYVQDRTTKPESVSGPVDIE
jgi:hypothetical protein